LEQELTTETQYTEAQKHDIFQSEFLPCLRALYNFGFRLTLDEDDARDLVQDTYLKAFRFINSFKKGTNAKAWMFRILKNSFINEYRKKRKEPVKVDYQDVENTYNSEEPVGIMNAELRVEALQEELGDEISNALNSLEEEFKTVILLCDVEGFKYEEIAEILDIPIGTVRSRLHRARQMLKEKLVRYAREMGIKTSEV
jgi:RNA polymerase sigma-70 factor (ECF subfamily)